MAEEAQYSSGTDTTTHKRKYEEPSLSQSTHRPTGFSAPIASTSPDGSHAPPPSYNSVPPPAATGIELAKQRAQEVAARLLNSSGATGLDAKRSKVENGASGFDASADAKPQYSVPSAAPISYAYQGTSKKIDIPNGRVGVIIGKGGETIKYLQTQSGAKIQVTRDMDADPNSPTRMVELMGTPDQIATAEKLINEVLAEAEAGGSGIVARRLTGQAGSEQFVMKIPNNKVGLVIGKGGETIKNMQAQTGARIQVIPLHLPPGDTSTERTLQIDGTSEQIESAKQLVNQVINENRLRNQSMSGGYPQQGYQARPPTSWVPPGAPMQQPGYGYVQPGAYSGPSPQYNMPQPPYPGYPSQSSGGYSSNWDQSSVPPQQSTHGGGYDYYGQQQQQNAGGPPPAADGTAYNYGQPPSSGYNHPGQGYPQDSYGGYSAPPQSGYGQPPTYDQQQGYGSASNYGSGSNPTQEGHTPSYGSQGDSTQPPPAVPTSMSQQGYGSNQQPSPNPTTYPAQGAAQPGYGMPPTSQAAYGSQPQAQSGYAAGYGPPPPQKPSGTPVYGQSTQSPSTAGGYGQSGQLQPGYPPAQPPSGYAQSESGQQRAPPPYGSAVQPGYGPPPYGAPPGGQPGYGQAPPSYNSGSYGSGYTQPPVYSADATPAQAAQQSGVTKASPQS
ncbi:glutenin, high molecular weight subunit DX5 isoform X1 [Prosopis cineraria]|uniref:glutenin, high molecular weight subunit DX5 isoform X1 n=1 Tax=Prosopis cineraria TaxID=364024 RepID=UPI00240F9948|nr:glutenin, high molecular weight subunit DX5 isoform X1 [Prosopis cineraria]